MPAPTDLGASGEVLRTVAESHQSEHMVQSVDDASLIDCCEHGECNAMPMEVKIPKGILNATDDEDSLFDGNMAVIDSGAAEMCSPNLDHFVPGSLVDPCGQRIVAAGNERHTVVKLGRMKTAVKLPDGSLGYIDTGRKLGWYVPSIAFPLFSVGPTLVNAL